MNGNGSAPHTTIWARGSKRAIARLYYVAITIIFIVGMGLAFYAIFGGVHLSKRWVPAGSLRDVEHQGVVYVKSANVFVVAEGPELTAFDASDPVGGERVYYCPSSSWFQEPRHGSRFDHLGYYRMGPAARGLDRVAVRVEQGVVAVNASQRTHGPPRGSTDGFEPTGPFCPDVPGDSSSGRLPAGG